jgi:hypothetical protein
MREILFRGKRLDNGELVEGFYAYIECDNRHVIITQDTYTEYGGLYYFTVDPITVGQYTGKTVETGKVFDGDIGCSVDGLFLVCWDEEKAAFVMRFYSYPYETLYLEEMWDDCKIIGNIHDNPELVEGGEG